MYVNKFYKHICHYKPSPSNLKRRVTPSELVSDTFFGISARIRTPSPLEVQWSRSSPFPSRSPSPLPPPSPTAPPALPINSPSPSQSPGTFLLFYYSPFLLV